MDQHILTGLSVEDQVCEIIDRRGSKCTRRSCQSGLICKHHPDPHYPHKVCRKGKFGQDIIRYKIDGHYNAIEPSFLGRLFSLFFSFRMKRYGKKNNDDQVNIDLKRSESS